MKLVQKKILGIPITISSRQEILEEIKKYLKKRAVTVIKKEIKSHNPFVIFTPNPEIISFSQKSPLFKKIVTSSQINIPDGYGLVWAMKKLYNLSISRLSGVDFVLDICSLAEKQRLRIGLIGGEGSVALSVAKCLKNRFPKATFVTFTPPQIKLSASQDRIEAISVGTLSANGKVLPHKLVSSAKEKSIATYLKQCSDDIVSQRIDILFVAFGFPKQEYFMQLLKDTLPQKLHKPLVMMAVGGTFDYISGNKKRAPIWIRERGFEWLYRLLSEPQRISRQIKGAEFFFDVVKKR